MSRIGKGKMGKVAIIKDASAAALLSPSFLPFCLLTLFSTLLAKLPVLSLSQTTSRPLQASNLTSLDFHSTILYYLERDNPTILRIMPPATSSSGSHAGTMTQVVSHPVDPCK
jgi:hypothetical protein